MDRGTFRQIYPEKGKLASFKFVYFGNTNIDGTTFRKTYLEKG